MNPLPTVLVLMLCEKDIVEEGTRNVTLVSTFTELFVDQIPSSPTRFTVYAMLTEGLGEATINLVIRHLETNEELYTNRKLIWFPDLVAEQRVLFRVDRCVFPYAGEYQLTLLLDGEWLAQRRLRVIERKE